MKYEPISIWHHPSAVDYEFRVTHALCDTEEEAFKVANQDWTFGLFISDNLHFGFLDKSGTVFHVPRANVKGYFLNPDVQDRIGAPIDISTKEGKEAASKAILEKDPAYMVSDDDYTEDPMITSAAGRTRIHGAKEVTPSRPLLFESIAYSIKPIDEVVSGMMEHAENNGRSMDVHVVDFSNLPEQSSSINLETGEINRR